MGMSIDEAIEKYKNQAEWEHSHNNMDYYEEYRQLTEWLEKYQKIEEAYKKYLNNMVTSIYADRKLIKALSEVLENGNND